MRNLILGTDWCTDCDDAVAMRLAAKAHKRGDVRLLGIVINACMEASASSLDGFLTLEGITDVPLGIDMEATDYGDKPSYQTKLAPYATRYLTNAHAEEGVRLYRRLLAAADGPVELVEIGYQQVLAALLRSGADDVSPLTGRELVAQRVSKCWVMAGKWDGQGEKEHNFSHRPRSRQGGALFCESCPVPVTFLGWEIGNTVITGDTLPHDDHLYRALCDHGSSAGRYSWDPMLLDLALIGDEAAAGYSTVQGVARVDAETGQNTFTADENGLHCYVIKTHADDYYRDRINKAIAPEA